MPSPRHLLPVLAPLRVDPVPVSQLVAGGFAELGSPASPGRVVPYGCGLPQPHSHCTATPISAPLLAGLRDV
jgi:hypothetical protein